MSRSFAEKDAEMVVLSLSSLEVILEIEFSSNDLLYTYLYTFI